MNALIVEYLAMNLGLTSLQVLGTGERAVKLIGEGGILFPLQGAHRKRGNTGGESTRLFLN